MGLGYLGYIWRERDNEMTRVDRGCDALLEKYYKEEHPHFAPDFPCCDIGFSACYRYWCYSFCVCSFFCLKMFTEVEFIREDKKI